MERLDRELTLDLPLNMNLDTFAAHFFNNPSESDNSAARSVQILNGTGKATITSFQDLPINRPTTTAVVVGNQFFQKIGETLFGFGGGSNSAPSTGVSHSIRSVSNSDIASSSVSNTMDILRNHIVIDSADFGTSATTNAAANELQQQLEYDKFMNEIWIGIVLTLIIISMVFCICSCFLYHQFRQWKRNYRHNLRQTQDIESVKLNPDNDDPVPEYTLVSGLPSYEAALELMQQTTTGRNTSGNNIMNGNGSCLIVYPSALFGAFMVNEKESLLSMSKVQEVTATTTTTTTTTSEATIPQSPSIGGGVTTTMATTIPMTENVKCQNIVVPRLALQQYTIPSYEEAMGCQPQQVHQQQQQQQQVSDTSDTTLTSCVIKSPPVSSQTWSEDDTTKVLLSEKK
ncbi:protein commissureless 2 [Episyrphus balteatus]|uniref:protein commissureless 2 n=1 Tax=Episyrphus balteatus TaxID=286459 RepID=UPI0024866BF3|nr:protein commissureless 2 [Episyrphus balteatus]